MAKFLYSSLFDNGTLSAVVDNEIDRQASSGRVALVFVEAMKTKYGVNVPATKSKFLEFRNAHVKFASLPAEERAKQDEKPVLWVPGHLLRSKCYGAMDAIAAGLTACERMADSADWVVLFAPAQKPKAATVPKTAPTLPVPVATFPALGASPKTSPAPATAPATAPAVQVSLADAIDVIEAALKAGTVPGDMVLRLTRAISASAKATMPAQKVEQSELLPVDDTATF